MELPIELKRLIEEAASGFNPKRLSSAAEGISKKYRAESADGSRLVTDSAETAAYSVVRMPATFGAVSFALTQARKHTETEILSVLDVGAGTGAAGWAAAYVFDEAEELICLEREENMISLGKKFMDNGNFPINYEWKTADISKDNISEKADLVTASYVLNELSPKKREEALVKLWNSAEKMLVIVEPGTKAGFSNIKSARETLISLGAKIVAPCPAVKSCPISGDDWCHFTERVARTKLHKVLKGGDAPYEDEKFSYIAAVKDNIDGGCCSSRILRHPKIESGFVTLTLCSSDGISERKITKKDGALFKAARKSDCGDEIDI